MCIYLKWYRKSLICVFVLSSSPLVPLTFRPNPTCLRPCPKLCPLSLLSRHSSLLPRCRLRSFAAHRKPWHGDRKLQPRWDKQLCHSGTRLHLKRRRRRRRPVRVGPLCGRPLPHPAVLPFGGGITLQQVWPRPAAWRQPATLTFYRLHSERPQVGSEGCVHVCECVCSERRDETWASAKANTNNLCVYTIIKTLWIWNITTHSLHFYLCMDFHRHNTLPNSVLK